MILSIFAYTCWPSVCCFWKKCLFSSSAKFQIRFFSLLIYISTLYILDINPYGLQIFSYSLGSLLICRLFLFLCSSFFVWCNPTKWILPLLLVVISNKLLPRPMSKSFFYILSLRNFIFVGLSFKSLIHFEWYKIWSNFIFLYTVTQFSQHHLQKRLFIPH